MRVGWCLAPPVIIDVLNRVRGPFNVSSAGLAAAEAAVRDVAYTEACRKANTEWRDWMVAEFRAMDLDVDDMHANFVLPRFTSREAAEACDKLLRQNGIVVRQVAGYKLPQALRISVGDEVACRRVTALVAEFLKGWR